MHQLHVTDHKVDCTDCHEQITHALASEELSHAASDCASCHPDHHREQVKMLMGTGGMSIPEQAATMTASRVQCVACHRERQVSATGTVVWKASADVCTACHTSAAGDKLQEYQEDVRESLADLDLALKRARETLGVAEVSVEQLTDLKTRMEKLEHDLEFLTVGNGIHNIHYATSLTRALFNGTTEVCRELGVPEPTATLPEGAYQLSE